MAGELEELPDTVRTQATKMRALVKTIESAPLNEVIKAVESLKTEIDVLVAAANQAAGLRI